MIKTLIFAIGAATVAASAAKAVTTKAPLSTKGARHTLPDENRTAVIDMHNDPVEKKYQMDYMFV